MNGHRSSQTKKETKAGMEGEIERREGERRD